MTKLLKSGAFKIITSIGLTVLVLGGGLLWYLSTPKFQDLTLELGSEAPSAADFQTKFAISPLVKLQTDFSVLDMTQPGQRPVVLRHGLQEYTVTLTLQDTVAPEVVFKDVTAYIDEIPEAKDFVQSVTDESPVEVTFVQPLDVPKSYGSAQVELLVTDASGNVTQGVCFVHYVWMEREFQLEYGDEITKEDLLLRPESDGHLLDQAVLDSINQGGIGEYVVTSVDGDMTCICTVTVVDTVAPKLELQNKKIYVGEPVSDKDFIVSATDNSGKVTVRLLTALDSSLAGTYTLVFEAVDESGNVTTAQATLEVMKDSAGPAFTGVKDMTVQKNSTPDFLAGVKATDSRDGQVSFTCDTSKVRLNVAGTYYAVYTAKDLAGNTTTYRRKVTVLYNEDDVLSLVESIAKKLPNNDPEALRDYVRDNIRYSHEWGGKNPTKETPEESYVYAWYGFKNKHGNCYVHAMCLEYLLKAKGFETQLIWAKDKSHYWNLVKIDGKWYHIDATPGNRHTKYSLMNDEQRYETLYIPEEKRQRDWDRTKWPACP